MVAKEDPDRKKKPNITIHLLLNIPRSKGNLTMKFVQLIEYNIRNIFHKKMIQTI